MHTQRNHSPTHHIPVCRHRPALSELFPYPQEGNAWEDLPRNDSLRDRPYETSINYLLVDNVIYAAWSDSLTPRKTSLLLDVGSKT